MVGENSTWRCFHCDEVFTDRKLAEDHFGLTTLFPAACVDQLRSDERAMRERAMFYERAWREALAQRDQAWSDSEDYARAVWMVGNMDTEYDKDAWWAEFAKVWQHAAVARRPTLVPKDIPMTDTPLSDDVVERVREAVITAAQTGGGSYRRDIDCVAGNPTRIARSALEAARYGEMVAGLKQAVLDLDEAAGRFAIHTKVDLLACSQLTREAARRADALLSSIGASQP